MLFCYLQLSILARVHVEPEGSDGSDGGNGSDGITMAAYYIWQRWRPMAAGRPMAAMAAMAAVPAAKVLELTCSSPTSVSRFYTHLNTSGMGMPREPAEEVRATLLHLAVSAASVVAAAAPAATADTAL